jgi:hypothetical protein
MMTAGLRTIAVHAEEPNHIDLARLDDDGGGLPPGSAPRARDDHFTVPMIPGAREPGMLTTFGVRALVTPDSPSTMDAVTIAARQREGGGAPNQRRPAREGSTWTRMGRTLRRALLGSRRAD